MKIVLDTNVLIAAALKGSFAESIIEMFLTEEDIVLLCSESILVELEEKLRSKFDWQTYDISLFSESLREIATILHPEEKLSEITRDPDDNKILECALSGEADLIVTADQDLLSLKEYRGIGIIHPKTFGWTFPQYFKKKQKK